MLRVRPHDQLVFVRGGDQEAGVRFAHARGRVGVSEHREVQAALAQDHGANSDELEHNGRVHHTEDRQLGAFGHVFEDHQEPCGPADRAEFRRARVSHQPERVRDRRLGLDHPEDCLLDKRLQDRLAHRQRDQHRTKRGERSRSEFNVTILKL